MAYKIPKPNTLQKKLMDELGPEYKMRQIEFYNGIYRKLNSCYHIEIVGPIRDKKTKKLSVSLVVWDVSNGEKPGEKRSAEYHFDMDGLDELKAVIRDVENKYIEPPANDHNEGVE